MLPNEGTGGLPKDGFDLITLKVICQGLKGQKRVKFGYLATCWQFIKNGLIFFLYTDIDQMSRDGSNGIIRKVIFKVEKVTFGQFSYNYRYYSVVRKCCPNLLHHVPSLL